MGTVQQVPGGEREAGSSTTSPRQQARERVQTRRDFGSHLVAYIVINACLVGAWALTGAGYFWPAWVMAGWGAGLVLHAWEAFVRRPITEADIDAELRRHDR
jgi:2TM domain